jgi:hypothetical protein
MRTLSTGPGWIVLVLGGAVLFALPARGQAPALPSAPVPVAPPVEVGRPVPVMPPSPLTPTPPPPPPPPTLDPGPDGWAPYQPPSQPPGLFFDTQIALVFPVIKNRLTNDSPPDSGTIQVPGVDLPLTVSPTFEIGYRLPESCGYFALAYRFLTAEGNGTAVVNGEDFAARTRLNLNAIDLDYGTAPYEFTPRWLVSWRLGARIADVFFDNRIDDGTLSQSASNTFFGSGAHGRLDVERRIVPLPGLALFGRVDGSVLLGQIQQRFHDFDGSVTTVRRTQTVPVLNVQAGLSYVPPSLPRLKLTTGYEYEQYFSVGRIGLTPTQMISQSTADVWWHGWFLRGQVDF